MNKNQLTVLIWITFLASSAMASPIQLSARGDTAAEFSQAVAYFNSAQYQKALRLFDKLAVADSGSTLNYYRGACLYQLGDYRQSQLSLAAVDSADSLYPYASYFSGAIMDAIGNPKRAVECFEVTVTRDSTYIPARIGMVSALCRLQRFGDARKFVSEKFSIPEGIALSERLIGARKYKDAYPVLAAILVPDPSNAAANFMLADFYFQTGKYSYAEKKYSFILQTFGPSPFVIKRLALCYGKMGTKEDYQTAIALMERYLTVAGDTSANDLGNIGLWYYDLPQYDSSRTYFACEVKLDTLDPEAQLNLGLALMGLGQTREAIKEIQIAYSLSKSTISFGLSILESLGAAQLELKEYNDAAVTYRRAIMIDPQDAESLYGLGLVYDKCHRPKEAIFWYRKFLKAGQGIDKSFKSYARNRLNELSK